MNRSITPDELEKLIAHEAGYFAIWSRRSLLHLPHTWRHKTSARADENDSDAVTPPANEASVWYLDSDTLPQYHSANRALRLRCHSDGAAEGQVGAIVNDIIAHYSARGVPVVADVDPVAEAQGFGRELRRRGVTPVIGSTLLMRYTSSVPPTASYTQTNSTSESRHVNETVTLERVPNETGQGEARDWIALAGADEDTQEDAQFWQSVAQLEARAPVCRLYLARVNEQPAATCQLYARDGWAQIDSVMTHPDFRRRGLATRLVSQAIADSLALGNTTTYLFAENGGAGEQVYRRLGFTVWGVDVLRRHLRYRG